MLVRFPVYQACSQSFPKGPCPLHFLAQEHHCQELGSFAKRSDTEMAPRKGRKKAAGLAKIHRTMTRSAEMEAKIERIEELKMKFAGVAKALRPALVEMAGRTSHQLGHSTYHEDGCRRAQYDALVVDLEKVRDSNIARRVAYHETHQELKAVSVQRETLQEMTTIESLYRVLVFLEL